MLKAAGVMGMVVEELCSCSILQRLVNGELRCSPSMLSYLLLVVFPGLSCWFYRVWTVAGFGKGVDDIVLNLHGCLRGLFNRVVAASVTPC
eukprot:c21389_g1_i1 orf=284-556(+)